MNKRLTKSNDKILAGCVAGIAEYLGWDVKILRVIYAACCLFSAGFPGLILYLILWAVMPNE